MKRLISIITSIIMITITVFGCMTPVFADSPVRETDVSEATSGNMLVLYNGEFKYLTKDTILSKINSLRLEACKEGVKDPRDPSRRLTQADYVPIKWSSDLEWIAQTRAAEGSMYMSHTRPNDELCFSAKHNGVSSYGEVLAWNYSADIIGGIEQWYREKSDWDNNTPGAVTGHYTEMIDPDNTYIGIGAFLPPSGYGTVAGEFCSLNGLDETQTGVKGKYSQVVEVQNYNVGITITTPEVVHVGKEDQILLSAEVYYTDGVQPVSSSVTLYDNFSWTSSDESIATVDAAGVIRGISEGTASITGTLNDISYTFEVQVFKVVDSTRIYGSDRFKTSLKVADELKETLGKDKFDAVILAYGRNYADALAGSYLSCVLDAPILLVDNKKDHIDAVQAYIKANLKSKGTIYMLGGTAVVPDSAVDGLDEYDSFRLGGQDRYETNIAILKEAAKYADDNEFIVCSGTGFADSLSAAAVGKPILLVKNTLQNSQKEYLDSLEGAKTFDVIGGIGAVKNEVMNEFKAYGSTTRIGGSTRYETSVNVAQHFFDNPKAGVLAYGQDFPDGLCGGSLAYAMNGPLILTRNGTTQFAEDYAAVAGMSSGAVLGGPTLINDKSTRAIFHMDDSAKIIVK